MNPFKAIMPLIATLSSTAQATPVATAVAPKQVVAPAQVVTDPMQSFEQWLGFQPPMPSNVKTPPPNTSASLSPGSVQLQQQQALAEIAKVKKAKPGNERTLTQDADFASQRRLLGIPDSSNPPSNKNYIVHWTGDDFRYRSINPDGSKNYLKDKEGKLIPKTAEELAVSMKKEKKAVNNIMTGITSEEPVIKSMTPYGGKVGHINPDKWRVPLVYNPIKGSEQTASGNTIFQTDARNKNSYGIEVAFDPSMPRGFSEKGKTILRDHLFQVMIEQGIPPSQLFAHGEIQRDRSGDQKNAGEMVDFMKDFRKNLGSYLEQYQERKMDKFEADYQVKDSGKNLSSSVDQSQKQKMDSFSKLLDSLGQKK